MSNVYICNKIFKIFCEMKTVQLQKHLSSNFSANLILAQVHSKSPCRRRYQSFRSVGKDDNVNQWVARMLCVLFALFIVYCSGNRLKINITPCGESSIIQLAELTHIFLVDFSILIIWTGSFPILGMPGVLLF